MKNEFVEKLFMVKVTLQLRSWFKTRNLGRSVLLSCTTRIGQLVDDVKRVSPKEFKSLCDEKKCVNSKTMV